MTQEPMAHWHTLEGACHCGGTGARVNWEAVSCPRCLENRRHLSGRPDPTWFQLGQRVILTVGGIEHAGIMACAGSSEEDDLLVRLNEADISTPVDGRALRRCTLEEWLGA